MKEENKDLENKDKKINLREMWKDKRGRAKIKLTLYGIFFIAVIIFARVLNTKTAQIENNNPVNTSFLKEITDNYEYSIEITIDDNIYKYIGKRLGYNSNITRIVEDEEKKYSIINNKYYALEENNYLLVNESEIYPYINYRYLDIENIKAYIKMSEKEENTYKLKLSNIILNGSNDKYIIITIDEANTSLVIDYTELFKTINPSTSKVTVNFNYQNINKIIALD